MSERTALWFGASGFEVLSAVHGEVDVTIDVQSITQRVGCHGCGVRASAKDRRWVTLRDAPAGNLGVVVRWWKRIWECPDPDCPVKTWSEQAEWALPRQSLTIAAQQWATDRIEAVEGTPASIARSFGVTWSTVWRAIEQIASERVKDADRVGPVAIVGFDETVMQPASRRRRRRFITAVVDVTSGQILDVFEGHDAKDLRAWMASMPASWLDQIDVVSVDPHEGYRSALTNPDPVTGRPSPLADTTMVVDPFHIVRLANAAVTQCRTRIQRETLQHRGWKGDPLFDIRKLLLMGAERVDEQGWDRIHDALKFGDLDDVLSATWTAKELVRNVYLTDDLQEATEALNAAIEWCEDPDSGPELVRLLKTLKRWRTEILNHHRTGASNGPVEAANLLIKQIKRSGRGFRNIENYRLRILLAGGQPSRETHQVTRIRPRSPRLVA